MCWRVTWRQPHTRWKVRVFWWWCCGSRTPKTLIFQRFLRFTLLWYTNEYSILCVWFYVCPACDALEPQLIDACYFDVVNGGDMFLEDIIYQVIKRSRNWCMPRNRSQMKDLYLLNFNGVTMDRQESNNSRYSELASLLCLYQNQICVVDIASYCKAFHIKAQESYLLCQWKNSFTSNGLDNLGYSVASLLRSSHVHNKASYVRSSC